MVDVDNLSDAELRTKLIEFGFPLMPITGTTRRTMVKKLKLLMDSKAKPKEGRRSLGRYSSEDESDSDKTAPKAAAKTNRRATMAAPPALRSPTVLLKRADSPAAHKETKVTTTTTRTTQVVGAASRDDYDTGSESDEVAAKYDSPPKRAPQGRIPPSFLAGTQAADAASDKITQMRSRLSQYNSPKLYTSSPALDEHLSDKENTPFLSNFTRRLSQMRESPVGGSPRSTYDYRSEGVKEGEANGGASNARSYLNNYRSSTIPATRGRPSYSAPYKPANPNILKDNFVPLLVLIVAFLFFIVVAVLYMGIRSDAPAEVSAVTPLCDGTRRHHVDCVTAEEGKQALHLWQFLKVELVRRALWQQCENAGAQPYMTENEIVMHIRHNSAIQNESRILSDLLSVEVMAFVNPAWGLQVVQADRKGGAAEPLPSMDAVKAGRLSKITALQTPDIPLPWKCYMTNTLHSLLHALTSIIAGVLILYLLNYTYKWHKQWRAKEQEEEVTIVENIIDILQTNASENEDNYMVINHVRDMILPVSERRRKEHLWKKAVAYINEHESRIRTEVQMVKGEHAEVWRWLGGGTSLNASRNKSWQGQAFEIQVGGVNSLPCSPTPCLKIRGMVDEGDRNTLVIKKAVLGKCATECRILHCAVDTNTNCVYLKCADQGDAAIAYRNLHGWWYAGNLVTVKYLRLERYMQRFPDSPGSGPPFLQ